MCVVGGRAHEWAVLLEGARLEAMAVEGGIDAWTDRGLPLVEGPRAY